MKRITDRYLYLLIRFFIGGLFIYAGLGKIMAPFEFAVTIGSYNLVPTRLIGLVAATLPWIEVLAGLGVILVVRTKACSLIISSLLAVFILILILTYLRGMDIDCGCFPGVDRKIGPLVIIEDLLMFFGAHFIYSKAEPS
jgi:putative oxidoreductase